MKCTIFVLVITSFSLLRYLAESSKCSFYSGNFTSLNELLADSSSCSSINVSITGNISLHSSIAITSTNVTLHGDAAGGKPTLSCENESGLAFVEVNNLELRHLRFESCGMVTNNFTTECEIHQEYSVKSAILIVASLNASISDVTVENSDGLGLLLIDSFGTVGISNCLFVNNSISGNSSVGYAGGGGIHIEFKSCMNNKETSYEIDNCSFNNNVASLPSPNSISSLDETAESFGRGGGIFISAASNTIFYIRECKFHDNTAIWGGAIGLYYLGDVHNGHVFLYNCSMEANQSPEFGGGGAFVLYQTGIGSVARENLILFETCTFKRNTAAFGGGLEFLGSFEGFANETSVRFVDCTFEKNEAYSSAAVDFSRTRQMSPQTITNIEFIDCLFFNNVVKDKMETIRGGDYAVQAEPGISTFTVLYLNITFSRSVTFRGNNGTALYVIAGVVSFDANTTANFISNSGYSAGAIALMVSSVMSVMPSSSFYFVRNSAVRNIGGGAIFARSVGLHKLHRAVTATCFITKRDNGQGNVRFFFSGNTALNMSNDVYSDSLSTCCGGRSAQPILGRHADTNSALSCFGEFISCDSCDSVPCFNCSSRNTGRIQGPPSLFKITDNLPLRVFPGQSFNLSLSVLDQTNNVIKNSYYLAHIIGDDGSGASVDASHRYVSNKNLQIRGPQNVNTTLVLSRLGLKSIQLQLKALLTFCPPGYTLGHDERCTCKDEQGRASYSGILCLDRAHITKGKWMGYMGELRPKNLYTSLCPFGFCSYNRSNSSNSFELPFNSSLLEEFMCGSTRQGRACGQCVSGHSVYFHSPYFSCRREGKCKLGWLFYFLAELLPLTLVYAVVVALNITFTSGYVNGFIFFAQVIETFEVNANGLNGLNSPSDWVKGASDVSLFIYNTFNLEFFSIEALSFCLWKGAGTLDVLVMKYVTITYAFFLVLITVALLNRCKLRCAKRAALVKYNIIHGLSSFFIICYVQCMRVSFRILLPTHMYSLDSKDSHYSIVYYSGHMDYFKGNHLFYAIPALLCLFFLVLLPPLPLLLFPHYLKLFSLCGLAESKFVKCISVPCVKLKPFFDAFQSSYKNNFRFVAGLFFVYRLLILIFYSASIGYDLFYLALGLQLIVMTLLHFLMQPHQNHWDNVRDVLIFSTLSVINGLSFFTHGLRSHSDSLSRAYVRVAEIVQLLLIFLPLMVASSCLLVKAFKNMRVFWNRYIHRRLHVDDGDYTSYYDHRSIRLASFN